MSNKINRDSIYIGRVVNLKRIKRNGNEVSKDKYIPFDYEVYRSILFNIDSHGYSNDLIYDSPKYPVLNHNKNNKYWNYLLIHNNSGNNPTVIDSVFIGPLLKKLGFSEQLTIDDIKYIEKNIFNKKVLDNHCYLFGLVPKQEEHKIIGWYDRKKDKNQYGIGPFKIYYEMNVYRKAIIKFGSDKKEDILVKGFNINLNAFKPARQEGKIKIKKIDYKV